jgi:vacuolar protein sorting-associated protein IST1
MFGKSFKSAKCKTTLRLAISRMKLIKNKSDMHMKQMRRDLAQLLQSGQEASARIRVEQIIREQNMMAAHEFIELFCELIVARLPIIESQKNCPIDLREAISSLIFAAPRCADIPELIEIRSLFGSKYGKEFVAAAAELRPDCGVNRMVIEKLSVRTPSGEVKLKLMKEIAKEHQIDWDPADSEKELLKTPEDMLDGPSKFVGVTKMTIESVKEPHQSVSWQKHEPVPQVSNQSTSGMPNSSRSSHSGVSAPYMAPSMTKISQDFASSATSVDSVKCEKGSTSSSVSLSSASIEHEQPSQASSHVKDVEYADLHQESLGERTSISMDKINTFATNNMPVGKYASAVQSTSNRMDSRKEDVIAKSSTSSNKSNESGFLNTNGKEWNMNFKDAASAAQAAAYSAEKACEAAKAAADLSNPKRFPKEGSTRAGVISSSTSQRDEETKDLSNSRITRKPSSNDFVQSEEQSFDGHDLYGEDYVETHTENAVSQESGNWQGSQEKGRGEVDSDYELLVKRTSRIDPYQQPSDRINCDNTTPIAWSECIRKEEKEKFDVHVSRKDSDVSDSDEEFIPGRRETVISHTNTRPSTSFYDSVRLNSSAEEIKLKRAEDSRNAVNDIKFDGKEEQRHVSKKDIDVSDSGEEFPPWRRETVISHANTQPSASFYDSLRLNTKSAEEIKLEHTEDSRNAVNDIKFDRKEEQRHVSRKDLDVSDSDEEFPPWRRETVISHQNSRPSTSFYDSVRLNSKSSEEIKLKSTEDSRDAVNDTPQFDDSPHGEPSDIKGIPRYTEHDSVTKSSSFVEEHNQLYSKLPLSQPPKRPPPGVSMASGAHFQSSLSNEKRPLGKVSALGDALSDSSSNEDEQSSLRMRGKPSSTSNDSGRHFVEVHAKNGKSQRNLHPSKERSSRPDHYHQPSNRVYHHDNKPSAGKSQPLRREEKDQLGHNSSPNMQETIPSISVEDSPSRRGNLRSSHSKTPASYMFYDSDGTTSESGEEIELERYNDSTSSKINKLPLFNDSSHGASSDFKHQNPKHAENLSAPTPNRVAESRIQSSKSNPEFPKHAENLSAPTPNRVAESRIQSSKSNPEFQPPKQSIPSVTVSSQNTQSPLSVGGSETSREGSTKGGSHVHPKLPDYDNLAAMFEAMKTNRR